MKYYLNPEVSVSGETDAKTELETDSHYSSLVLGSDNHFNLIKNHVELKENEYIAGISVDEESTINVFIKKK